jgi:hypothetical protein
MRKKLLIRFAVIAAVIGATLFWQKSHKPVDLTLAVNLEAMKPREVTGIDVVVRRDGRLLTRHEMTFGTVGAPSNVELVVHAPPGAAEVETTANYQGKPSRRVTVKTDLSAEGSNTIHPE